MNNTDIEYDGSFEIDDERFFYRAKDDTNSSNAFIVNHEEHIYRMIEVFDSNNIKKGDFSLFCGDSYQVDSDKVKKRFLELMS